MAWSSSSRKERLNAGWERTRKFILERDDYRCQQWVTESNGIVRHKCFRPANEVDHIVRSRSGGRDDDSPGNLQALCSYHHKLKTARESAEQRRENRERREEEEWYSHPAFR